MFRIRMVALFVLGFLALTAIIALLWNALLPALFGWPVISYAQAAGLFILSRILFGRNSPGFFPGRFTSHDFRGRYGHLSREEKIALREKWRSRCEQRRQED